jgi:hypothetical protein
MAALARVGVLIERCAVEAHQPVRIVGEMSRHPVEQDPYAGAMAGVDKM